jgi:hypothetical protein
LARNESDQKRKESDAVVDYLVTTFQSADPWKDEI